MKKLIWLILLLPILLTGSKQKEQWHYELPFRAFDLNDSIPTINQFGQTRNGIIVDALVNACNADPSGVKLTPVELDYIRALVGGMYVIGTWQNSNAVYGFVGGNAFKHKFNWKAPTGSFNLSFFGNITHNSLGMKGDGATGYANTNLTPSTSLILNSTHVSLYATDTDLNASAIDIASNTDGINKAIILIAGRNNNLLLTTFYNQSTNQGLLISSVRPIKNKYVIASKLSSNFNSIFENGEKIAFTATTGGLLPTNPIVLMGAYTGDTTVGFFSKLRLGLVTIGAGFTDKQAIQQSRIVTYSQTILGRQ
jgi:hypothetical protein